jgi:hypothetical protein
MRVWEGAREKMVHLARIRQMVRLIELHMMPGFSESAEWAEIQTLSTHKGQMWNDSQSFAAAKYVPYLSFRWAF